MSGFVGLALVRLVVIDLFSLYHIIGGFIDFSYKGKVVAILKKDKFVMKYKIFLKKRDKYKASCMSGAVLHVFVLFHLYS